ncbi:MAG: hypothetical protein O7H41_11545 [Planctomycetota bacterium]|nr:hypothetical protein [Planctomycetota bacterium]
MARTAGAWALYAAALIVAMSLASCGAGDDKTTVIQQGGGSPPGIPLSVTAIPFGSGRVLIDWDFEPLATSYKVYWSTAPGVTTGASDISVLSAPFHHECLSNGTTYYYALSAVNPFGESALSNEASAAPSELGVLDWTFGLGGVVFYDGGAQSGDAGAGIAVDSSGRILVAGWVSNFAGNSDMALWRYQKNGTPDTSFGIGGVAIHGNAAGGDGGDEGIDLVLDAGGRVLVSGASEQASGFTAMTIWAFDSTGMLDLSFGSGGFVTSSGPAGSLGGNARGIALDGAGRIFVAGVTADAVGGDMALWAYDLSGVLDATFGTSGIVKHHNAAGGDGDDSASDVVVDTQGRIVVVGRSRGPDRGAGFSPDMVIWRFDATGSLDPTFGNGGIVAWDSGVGQPSDPDWAESVAMDAGGRILVCGSSNTSLGNLDMMIWAYDDSGNPDLSFGLGGIVRGVNPSGGSSGQDGVSLTFDSQDRILVLGSTFVGMTIWRYSSSGALDTTFGNGGVLIECCSSTGFSVTLDPCERVMITGALGNDMAIWRYH